MKKLLIFTLMAIVIRTSDGLAAVVINAAEDVLGNLYHEFEVWEETRNRNDIDGFKAYLVAFPVGNFRDPAVEALRRLHQQHADASDLSVSSLANVSTEESAFSLTEPSRDQVAALPKTQPIDPNVPAVQAFEQTLSNGELRHIQRDLRTMGHFSGAIDAVFGTGTRRGIRAYQDTLGNDETGYVTATEYRSLRDQAEKSRLRAQSTAAVEKIASKAGKAGAQATKAKRAREFNAKGRTLFAQGRYDKAIAQYNVAIALDPKFAAAYHNRGVAYEVAGKRDRAAPDFEKAFSMGFGRL